MATQLNKTEYVMLHKWVRRELGKPSECENCGTTEAKRFEWANLSGEYLRDLSDWARLCTSCHRLIDFPAGTECRRGHAYTTENTFNRKNGKQDCKTCRRLRHLRDKGVLAYV